MRIGEVAKRAHITPSTLRYYEQIGLIAPPERVNGQRWYDEGIFEALNTIRFAQSVGFSLDEIRGFLRHPDEHRALSDRLRPLIQYKLSEVQALIRHYESIRDALSRSLDCTCTNVKDCDLHPMSAR